MTTTHDEARAARLAAMTPAERAEYDAALIESDLALELAQLVYDTRKAAGLSQAELARRMGTSQSTISQIENAGQVPSVAMLRRLAKAVGHDIPFVISAA